MNFSHIFFASMVEGDSLVPGGPAKPIISITNQNNSSRMALAKQKDIKF